MKIKWSLNKMLEHRCLFNYLSYYVVHKPAKHSYQFTHEKLPGLSTNPETIITVTFPALTKENKNFCEVTLNGWMSFQSSFLTICSAVRFRRSERWMSAGGRREGSKEKRSAQQVGDGGRSLTAGSWMSRLPVLVVSGERESKERLIQ